MDEKKEKKDKFRAAALEQKKIFKMIADSDHAGPELSKLKLHIADLRNQVWDESQRRSALRDKMDKEKTEFEDIQKSRVKRLAYVLGGQKKKHDSKVEKEEKEYLEILAEFSAADAKFKELERNFEDAKKKRTELEALVEKHVDLQNQAEGLANSVFDGPSPEFPKDDEAEEQLQKAQEAYEELQATFFSEAKTVDGLSKALGHANGALGQLRAAIGYCKSDIKRDIFGPTATEIRIHSSLLSSPNWEQQLETNIDNCLQRAQQEMLQATILANHTLENVGMTGVALVKIPERHIVWNLLLDCIVTDVIFREKLKEVEVDVEEFRNAVSSALDMFTPRHEALKEQVRQRHEEFIAKRQELVDARMKLLEQIIDEEKV